MQVKFNNQYIRYDQKNKIGTAFRQHKHYLVACLLEITTFSEVMNYRD